MKKFIYLLTDEERNVVAAYDRLDLVNKLKSHIEKKLNVTLEVQKVQVNKDLAQING